MNPFALISISSNRLINAVVELLVLGLIVWLIFWVLAELGAPAPIQKVVKVVAVVLVCLFAISLLLNST